MTLQGKRVAIIGAGVAGLTAADALARRNATVRVIDKASEAGGHAGRFGCKATDRCVACGACVAEEKTRRANDHANVSIFTGAHITQARRNGSGWTIEYTGEGHTGPWQADALLVTSGFAPYDPSEKPYGYGQFANVLTNLDAERILRTHGRMVRPSDGRPPERMAFIQCVGSRDARIGHPWCSKICCGSSLRMASLIQHRQPGVAATFFYIDVQTFGKNFERSYAQSRKQVEMVRAIPGDIFQTDDDRLKAVFFDPRSHQTAEALFDMVILAVGLIPSPDTPRLARMLDWPLTPTGFFQPHDNGMDTGVPGLFTAGAALGPMSIAESIDSAGKAARDVLRYLRDFARE